MSPQLAGATLSDPTPRHNQSPAQTPQAYNHKSHPRKHSPTTGSHKNILQQHRGKLLPNKSLFSSTQEQQAIKPLYARTWPLFLNWRHRPQEGTSLVVGNGEKCLLAVTGYMLSRWWLLWPLHSILTPLRYQNWSQCTGWLVWLFFLQYTNNTYTSNTSR